MWPKTFTDAFDVTTEFGRYALSVLLVGLLFTALTLLGGLGHHKVLGVPLWVIEVVLFTGVPVLLTDWKDATASIKVLILMPGLVFVALMGINNTMRALGALVGVFYIDACGIALSFAAGGIVFPLRGLVAMFSEETSRDVQTATENTFGIAATVVFWFAFTAWSISMAAGKVQPELIFILLGLILIGVASSLAQAGRGAFVIASWAALLGLMLGMALAGQEFLVQTKTITKPILTWNNIGEAADMYKNLRWWAIGVIPMTFVGLVLYSSSTPALHLWGKRILFFESTILILFGTIWATSAGGKTVLGGLHKDAINLEQSWRGWVPALAVVAVAGGLLGGTTKNMQAGKLVIGLGVGAFVIALFFWLVSDSGPAIGGLGGSVLDALKLPSLESLEKGGGGIQGPKPKSFSEPGAAWHLYSMALMGGLAFSGFLIASTMPKTGAAIVKVALIFFMISVFLYVLSGHQMPRTAF